MSLTGVGEAAALINTVVSRIWPDKTVEEQQQIAAVVAAVQGQLDTNKAEAGNENWFVAGWRPAVGWVCALGFFWNMILLSVVRVLLDVTHQPPMQLAPADLSQMMPILIGMLGLGGLRTVEKISGVPPK